MVKRLPSTRMAAPFLNWFVDIVSAIAPRKLLFLPEKRRDIIAHLPACSPNKPTLISPRLSKPKALATTIVCCSAGGLPRYRGFRVVQTSGRPSRGIRTISEPKAITSVFLYHVLWASVCSDDLFSDTPSHCRVEVVSFQSFWLVDVIAPSRRTV